jgi:CheY-like chemotaxis protein
MNSKGHILWIDDEIEVLKPHIILLEKRGYDVDKATNGEDAIELVKTKHYDLIFLDENMVGMSGLDTLPELKRLDAASAVVMVTKNEAESVMEEAIGLKIDDYLTKPVNPAQILLACKKFLETERIETEKFTQDYMKGFSQVSRQLMGPMVWNDWVDVYKKLVQWSFELDKHPDSGLKETLSNQWSDSNTAFSRFVEDNYVDWINSEEKEDLPLFSPDILDAYLWEEVEKDGPTFLFVVDCMRYDQWLLFEEVLRQYYTFETNFYCSILPTATPYCRNSLFAGLFPSDIKKYYPQYWQVEVNSEEHTQNKFEKELMQSWLQRRRIKLKNDPVYIKIFDTDYGKRVEKDILKFANNDLTAIVLNAVDMIAHSRSDYAILKEIAPDESAYRSLTSSWFKHSSFLGMLKQLSNVKDAKIIITTDHGSIRCLRGVKVLGDKDTSTSLRYKFGKNVKADPKTAMQIGNPEDIKVPKSGITVNNIIAKEDYYFVYPTDYHHYLNKYRDSFQHGGISMEEMIIPVIKLKSR